MFDEALVQKLRNALHVVVFTGAGISAESGVPTFRDAQSSLWSQFDPMKMASPEGFLENSKQVLDWYAWRRNLIAQAQPNAAHLAIARMQKLAPLLTLITQNVDGLHQRAGNCDVIELHGNIFRMKCSACDQVVENGEQGYSETARCLQCGGLLRPDVVWFGESLAAGSYGLAKEAVRSCDVFLSVGTSSKVYPAAVLPFEAAERGKTVIQVNPEATTLNTVAHYNLMGKAGEMLPALVKAVWG